MHKNEDEILWLTQENERLRWELAGLASHLNDLYDSPIVGQLGRYRAARFRFKDLVLRAQNAWRRDPKKVSWDEKNSLVRKAAPGVYDVMFFSNADWQWRTQRPQHLCRQWAAHGHRVFFVSPDFRAHVNPRYGRPARAFRACEVYPGVLEINLAGSRSMNPGKARMVEPDVQELLSACATLVGEFDLRKVACVLEFPFWAPLALELRERYGWPIAYDLIDRHYGVFPRSHSVLSEEAILIREADLVVATAQILAEEALRVNPDVIHIPNAADVDHFMQPVAPRPLGLPSVGKPVIGYVGALADWFDTDLVYSTAAQHPEWQFVLVGSGSLSQSQLSVLPNVILAGEKPYADLPAYLSLFDVAIIPFRALPVTAATDPVKFYEYLAAGKPVVTTNLRELQHRDGLAYVAEKPQDFSMLIRTALQEDSPALQQQRREFALDHCWHSRFLDYDRAVMRMLESVERDCFSLTQLGLDAAAPSVSSPVVRTIRPATIRPGRLSAGAELEVTGDGFTVDCQIFLDEQPLPGRVDGSRVIRGQLPRSIQAASGCFMVSVMDLRTGKQSNRRLLHLEGIV